MALVPGHAVALRCLAEGQGGFLDGRVGNGSVGLAPNLDPPFTGTRWIVADAGTPGVVILACTAGLNGPHLLDGRILDGSAGLAPHLNPPFSGTRWQNIGDGPSAVVLKCLGTVEGERRFLDGRIADGSVGLAPQTTPPFTGTHWEVHDLGLLPAEVHFDDNSITFGDGAPVGGSAHLVLRSNGSFTFSGHFHDSGATEHNVNLFWGIKDLASRVFTVQQSGHVSGTFEAGSRNFDFTIDSQNIAIAQNWPFLALGSSGTLQASVTLDFVNLGNTVMGILGLVTGVIGVVALVK
jgi:hypothetical protein